jgi:hypothetical protein
LRNCSEKYFMSVLDLKPLTKDFIQEMGLSNHELWVVKIGEDIYGPYDTDSLKQYASKNEELFDDALASRLDNNDLQPFFSHALFQRRSPQLLKNQNHDGPFWIMHQGLKTGPFPKMKVEKQIEMGSLGLNDLISSDDGHTWHKVYEVSDFDRRLHSSSDLPFSPLDSSFQKAKTEVMEKIERHASEINMTDELAHVAHGVHHAKVLKLKLDEIPMKPRDEIAVSGSLKYALPVAIVVVMTLVGSGAFVSSDSAPEMASNRVPSKKIQVAEPQRPAPNPSSRPTPAQMPIRRPASVAPAPIVRPKQDPIENPYAHESQYPTQIETHIGDRAPTSYEPDPYGQPIQERVEPVMEEHSLIGNLPGEEEQGMSLDAVMGGEPVVEEISDF